MQCKNVRDNNNRLYHCWMCSGSLSHLDCTVSHIHRQTAITTRVYCVFSGTHRLIDCSCRRESRTEQAKGPVLLVIVDKSVVVDNNCRKALLHNLLIIYAYDILKKH